MSKGAFKQTSFMRIALTVIFAAEIAALVCFFPRIWQNGSENRQDAVAVNEAAQSVKKDWDDIAAHVNQTELDYVVLNEKENVIYRTKAGLSESINAAISHRDTILDIEKDGDILGKIIVYNGGVNDSDGGRNELAIALVLAVGAQLAVCLGYTVYFEHKAIRPFQKLKGFAERVAGGNLDIPLEMDRENLFGAFTESFDIMRAELKKARLAEAKANASKKELVAKLSHDIRTPVASIKAVSELGAAVSENEKTKENFCRIISKADQINTLVGNLFSATLEELQQLTVAPSDMSSKELKEMLENADYFHRAIIPEIAECMIYADKLRLQQVFDNIFANSYKYADTDINVKTAVNGGRLAVEIEDLGGGVRAEELPLLKEKWGRGSNTKGIDGAGLGLYISDRFMREMKGELAVENGENGLKITVFIMLSHIVNGKFI